MANDSLMQGLRERLQSVRARIADAARLAGRQPDEITLIGVSKFFPAEMARAAVEFGLKDLGENRVQEMLTKIDILSTAGLQPNWHMIGSLQKNKVRQIVGRTHLIHSIDSLALLTEISHLSQTAEVVTDVLLEVNVSGEVTKHGFTAESLDKTLETGLLLPGIRLRGLMTMAPLMEVPDDTLPIFNRTKELFERLADQMPIGHDFSVLSMGMSLDFCQAIRCGATHVRIGTAIFGPRL